MNNAGNSTHKTRAVDPKTFRDAATGIGQCFSASVETGAARAQQAINCAPASQRAVADRSYPKPNGRCDPNYQPVESGASLAQHRGLAASPVPLRKAGR